MSRALALTVAVSCASCGLDEKDADWQLAEEREASLAIESSLEPSGPQPTGSTLRVVTFNVEFGRDVEALAALFALPPFDVADVFLVQEIDARSSEGTSRARRLAQSTGMGFVYLPAKHKDDGTSGMAIFSRRQMSDVRFMNLPRFTTSVRKDTRVALAVTIDEIDLVNVHLGLQMTLSERIVQLAPATRELAPLVALGGDFNTNPYAWSDMLPVVSSDPITDIDAAAVVDDAMDEFGFLAATAGSGATHETPAGSLRLDSIYTRGLAVSAPRVERSVDLSDHWPLWLDIEKPAPQRRQALREDKSTEPPTR